MIAEGNLSWKELGTNSLWKLILRICKVFGHEILKVNSGLV